MFTTLEGSTADELWLKIADRFNASPGQARPTRVGEAHEIMRAGLCLHNPRERWVVSRTPAINPAFALAEVVWILRGRNDSAFLNYFNRQLPQFAGHGSEYHGAYGHRLRFTFGFDQLERALNVLKSDPGSRQVVLQIWHPGADLPANGGVPKSPDIPCNLCSLLKIRDGRLEWTQIMRSNDIFRGLPYNFVQFTFLQEIIAGWLGVDVGEYHHFSDSLHLYSEVLPHVAKATKVPVEQNPDRLCNSFEESESIMIELEGLIDLIGNSEISSTALSSAFLKLDIPRPWKNVASVLATEGLRRRGNWAAIHEMLGYNTNPQYKMLVKNWLGRFAHAKSGRLVGD